MEAILDAIGSFGKLAAEGLSASEERRAQILAEADTAWRAYRESLVGLWAGLRKDDAEMASLAKPLPTPVPVASPPAPAVETPPVETPPVVVPQPSGVE